MNLRAYFAAHAPAAPDWWPKATYKIEYSSRLFAGWPAEKLNAWQQWGDGLDDEDVGAGWLTEFKAMAGKLKDLEVRNEAARLKAEMARETSWRWTYADSMAATESPESGGI